MLDLAFRDLTFPRLGRRSGGGGAPAFPLTQTASFGSVTPASSGGWRPQLATGAVESLVSYDGLVSGSLGVYTPSIASGRLVFAGAAGAPNGAVLTCTGASGRVYTVTVATTAGRKDIATDADVQANRLVGPNYGLEIVVRQNAQIPARDRTVATTDWLSATTQIEVNFGVTQPITLRGEGPIFPTDPGFTAGEYHLYSIRSFFPSSTTIRRLKFADQKTKHPLLLDSTASRIGRNYTIDQCYFDIFFDVDVTGNWSTGFGSTGFAGVAMLSSTGGYHSDITVTDCMFIGGYISSDMTYNGTLIEKGNYYASPYFDYCKSSTRVTVKPEAVRICGGNFYGKPKQFSVNETPITEPHLDMDQQQGAGDHVVMVYDDVPIKWHTNGVGVQGRFHSDRPTAAVAGYRWSIVGEMQIISSPHTATCDYPDNMVVDRLFILPNTNSGSAYGTGNNRVFLGTSKALNGGTIGAHRIDNSVYAAIGYDARGPVPGDVTETNVIKYGAETGAYFADKLARWGDWGSLPAEPTYTEALTYFAPVPASAFDGLSPQPYITPGASSQSDYVISDTLRPAPNLSSLTVTTAATAAFTVVTDIATNSTVHWAVFPAEVTDPVKIVAGINANVAALANGLNHRGNSAGTVTGGGTASLGAGTYWLCVAQYNGPKKVDVATLQFTV